MNLDPEMFRKIVLDLSLKTDLITPEIFALKYDISNELYEKIQDKMYLSLARNDGYTETYHLLEELFEDEAFDITKYNELLRAFKTDLELKDACDGELYKNICDWIQYGE